MKANVVRIGNSRGIRIPKAALQECKLGQTVELGMRQGHLVVRAADGPRRGWEGAFRRMARRRDNVLLDRGVSLPSRWDESEWEW